MPEMCSDLLYVPAGFRSSVGLPVVKRLLPSQAHLLLMKSIKARITSSTTHLGILLPSTGLQALHSVSGHQFDVDVDGADKTEDGCPGEGKLAVAFGLAIGTD